jgi:4-amino-4-deoxy-L-arabinose transferase-like glycosyltransferase
MVLSDRLDRWGRGWRGPLAAAILALIASLPGLIALPPLDRDESRFAEASAQMLESGDFVSIDFQETPRFKKPVGVYWLQAAAVAGLSHVEDRQIWAYRIPSLLGAMLAAAACAWGAGAFLRAGSAMLAGGMLGTSFMLSTEAGIAATDGVLCGAVTLAMAALGRIYLASRGGPPVGRLTKALFWAAFALSVLVKGPIGPMVVGLTLLSLCLWDRRVRWLKDLGWGWGLILLAAVVGPWALAITVATDGAFWGSAVAGDLAPKLIGEQEGHGAPPGFYAVLAPLLLFPAALLAPAGLAAGWRARAEPAVRFALCWLVPTWLVFEIVPTKLVHYTLPAYGALAWLMARALEAEPGAEGAQALGRTSRRLGAALVLLAAVAFAVAGPAAMAKLSDWSGASWALIAGVLYLAAGGVGATLLWRGRPRRALIIAGALAVTAHAVLAAALAPSLRPLWLSNRAASALERAGVSPSQGVTPGPVTVAGYQEPSLVFLLGADTELGDGQDAAAAVTEGRPAIVEAHEEGAFRAALGARGGQVKPAGLIAGLDYSTNRHDILRLYRPLAPAASPGSP